MKRPAPWQVWWVDFDPQIGREQAGHRPAIVVGSAFHNALASTVALVVPVTSRETGLPYRVPVKIGTLSRVSFAVTEQITTVDYARLDRQIARLAPDEIAHLRAVLSRMVDW